MGALMKVFNKSMVQLAVAKAAIAVILLILLGATSKCIVT